MNGVRVALEFFAASSFVLVHAFFSFFFSQSPPTADGDTYELVLMDILRDAYAYARTSRHTDTGMHIDHELCCDARHRAENH